MNKEIIIVCLFCFFCSVRADSVRADFNQSNTQYSVDGAAVGSGWENSDRFNKWKRVDGNLAVKLLSNPAVLYNTTEKIEKAFSVSADVCAIAGWAGIVFNYQDPENFYYLRIKTGASTYHLNARINGVDKMLSSGNASTVFTAEQKYTLTVSSDAPCSFSYTITEAGSPAVLNSNIVAVDLEKRFSGGFVGLYCPSGSKDPDALFDNFRLEPLATSLASNDPVTDELLRKVAINQTRNITDQDFFGVFDPSAGEWKGSPMINYTYAPDLEPVCDAAKTGDYGLAAERLLSYYRLRKFERQSLPANWSEVRVSLLMDNIIGFDQQEKIVTVFEITKDPSQAVLDVTGTIRAGRNSFMLMGRHKNEAVSYISSREASGNQPILELLIDGKWVAYPASADVYIRAGRFEKENYGKKEKLEVCNSGLKTGCPFDDDTRRTLIEFDLPGVDPDRVEQARLKLYAWSPGNSDQLILWRSYPTLIDEEKATWNNTLGYQYSWEKLPGDIEWGLPVGAHSQYPNWVRRLPWLGDLATKAVRTGDAATGKKTISLLRDFIEEYNVQPRPNGELNAGLGRLPALCKYGPYLFDLDVMTPRDCVEILKFLCKEGEYMVLNPSKLRRSNFDNMGLSLIAAITTLSVTYPELSDAVLWQKDASARADELMGRLVLKDGAYTEHTMGYPFPVLGMMLDLLEFCKQQNAPLPESFSSKTHQLARYLMNASLPDGVPPAWGEGGPRSSKADANVQRAAQYFSDPELQWWCGLTKDSHIPQYTSVHYPDAKIVMFRSSWEPDALAMFVSSRVGGGHYHVDQNHLSLSAYGSKLLVDTGMSSYSGTHPHFDWQRHQTKSHNTVEVDEKGFPRLETLAGKIEEGPCETEFHSSSLLEYYEGWADGYPTVRQYRRILYVKEPGFFIVYDQMVPKDKKEHIYDQCWHLNPTFHFDTDASTGRIQTENPDGANLTMQLMFPSSTETELLVRDGFNASPLGNTRYPSFRQKKTGVAEFCTLLLPTKPGGSPVVSSRIIPSPTQTVAFTLELPDYNGFCFFNGNNEIELLRVGAFEIKAQSAYIRVDQNGNVEAAGIVGGDSLSVKGVALPFEKTPDGTMMIYEKSSGN